MRAESLFRKLISINSVTGREGLLYATIADMLKDMGFSIKHYKGNIIAEQGNSPVVFAGHIDTLPPRMGITGDPFKARVVGKRMYGLGAFHMKSGLASMLLLAESGVPMKIVLATNELTNHEGSWELVNSGIFDNAEFAVSLHGSEFGPRSITIGRAGKILLKTTVINRTKNPIPDAMRIIENLENETVSFHPNIGFSSMEPIRLETISKTLEWPEKVLIDFKRTLVPPESPESIINQAMNQIRKLNIESAVKVSVKRGYTTLPPYETNLENKFVMKLSDAVSGEYRNVSYIYQKEPCMDNLISHIVPTVSFGPRGGFEGPNEWASIKSIVKTAEILKNFMKKVME